jgi:hypothetical protein
MSTLTVGNHDYNLVPSEANRLVRDCRYKALLKALPRISHGTQNFPGLECPLWMAWFVQTALM